ncbi:hypothetical protein [Pelagicoccus sp. SDUM812003]|uniref:hypothetical protein n=1 Tax=Pelagicoccus sp. SDUM812003 TaxID=3041267 RepID=UPI0028108AE3|nr:hypothetical protein [Pelagicoccus sp. SDUM812003]MDQ8202451.1 hypothetical protein [Pelagicoccus sp. SDUM812003]
MFSSFILLGVESSLDGAMFYNLDTKRGASLDSDFESAASPLYKALTGGSLKTAQVCFDLRDLC